MFLEPNQFIKNYLNRDCLLTRDAKPAVVLVVFWLASALIKENFPPTPAFQMPLVMQSCQCEQEFQEQMKQVFQTHRSLGMRSQVYGIPACCQNFLFPGQCPLCCGAGRCGAEPTVATLSCLRPSDKWATDSFSSQKKHRAFWNQQSKILKKRHCGEAPLLMESLHSNCKLCANTQGFYSEEIVALDLHGAFH